MTDSSCLIHLPDIALEKIFSFLPYDELAKDRLVCTKFNIVCGQLLTRGFLAVEKRHMLIYKRMKSLLPRRESERRSHPLARHCDILSAVETRISMLNMTFMKYIESSVCCFIPGKVIDEIERILTLVESGCPPPRTHELLQELRDISSMAMEHFDESILPKLKSQVDRQSLIPFGPTLSKAPKLLIVQHAITDEIHKVRKQAKSNKHKLLVVMQMIQKLARKVKHHRTRIERQCVKISEQERKIQEQSVKIQEQDTSIADLKKHIDEWEQKFADLTAEINRAREELPSKTIASSMPKSPFVRPASPKFYKSNIKPRIAQILPKSFSVAADIERKRKSSLLNEIPSKVSRSITSESDICNIIAKNITDNLAAEDIGVVTESENRGSKINFGSFISSSLETILKTPINSIKSRKRKMAEDIDLK